MRLSSRISLVASFAVVALSAACSDSSGPSAADQATTVATRFDSIYADAFARSDSGSNGYGARAAIALLLEVPAAFGAVPSTVSVTTATGTEQWKAYEFVDLTNSGGTGDSSYVVLAYREAQAHTVLAMIFSGAGPLQVAGLITGDTIGVSPTSLGGATALVSVGASCRTPPTTLTNPEFASPLESACSLATFRTSMSVQFDASSPGLDPALASVSFSMAVINGIRVVDPVNLGPSRVGALVRTLRSVKRF